MVADSHTLAGAHQFGQIGVESVVWEPRHFSAATCAVAASGERNAQNFACYDGIFAVCFVEVAHAIKQHRIGVLRLHLVEVLHHWSQFFTLCHNLQNYKKEIRNQRLEVRNWKLDFLGATTAPSDHIGHKRWTDSVGFFGSVDKYWGD